MPGAYLGAGLQHLSFGRHFARGSRRAPEATPNVTEWASLRGLQLSSGQLLRASFLGKVTRHDEREEFCHGIGYSTSL